MKISLINEDSNIGVDHVFFEFTNDTLPDNLRVVQWDTETNSGESEWTNKDNESLTSFPYPELLEWAISEKDTYDNRLVDPYYGLTEAEEFEAKSFDKKIYVDNLVSSGRQENFLYDSHYFYVNDDQIIRDIHPRQTMCLTLDPSYSFDWVTADRNEDGTSIRYAFTCTSFLEFGSLLALRNTEVYFKGKGIKDQIDSATTLAEIDGIDVEQLWGN